MTVGRKAGNKDMGPLLMTLLAGFLGGALLQRLRVPGGMMLGSVAVVALLNINTPWVDIPSGFRFVAQCITGAYIGMTVQKKDLPRLKHLFKPVLTLLCGLLLVNLLVGFAIYLLSPLDLLTAMLCAVPGGISDMPLIAVDLGADAPKVAVMQFVRLISGLAMIPLLVRQPGETVEATVKTKSGDILPKTPKFSKSLSFALLVAVLAGYLGKVLEIPAGTLLFAMLSVVLLKLCSLEVAFPLWFKRIAQLFSGAYIGSHFGYRDFQELKFLLLPAVFLVVVNVLACLAMGHFLSRAYRMPLSQAILSSSPAGASDMALIASDLGVSGSDVALVQIFRLLGAVALFPQIIRLLVEALV